MVALLVAGWLADVLAATDRDVDAGIAAYEAGNAEQAVEHYDAAQERRGERPEIFLDRGLALLALERTDDAQTAFERASESEDATVRASGFYELGNLALDAEQWQTAIDHYIEALKARPEHANAKWNLELALLEKKKEEEEEEEEEEKDEEEEEKEEEEKEEEEKDEEEEEEKDEQQETEGQGEPPEEDPPAEDGATGGEQPPPPEPAKEDSQEQQAPPQPLEKIDVDKALEQLDEQDRFDLDRPIGGYVAPEKDW
jgi:Ca-activated chloride channel family protein